MQYNIYFYIISSLVLSALLSPFIIWSIKRFKLSTLTVLLKDKSNEEFDKILGQKSGTPAMGGMMIFISMLIFSIIALSGEFRIVALILITAIGLIGFLDDIFSYTVKYSEKYRKVIESFGFRVSKLLIVLSTLIFAFWFLFSKLNISSINLVIFDLPINLFTIILTAFASVFIIYGIEINDGIDGMVTGNSIIVALGLLILAVTKGDFSVAILLAGLIGALFTYLYYNIHPAQIFMGASGTFPIAAVFLIATMKLNILPFFLIMGIMFWLTVGSSALQIISIKFFKKRLFKIAPLHHWFQSYGWPEVKVTQRYWLFTSIFTILSLALYFQFVH